MGKGGKWTNAGLGVKVDTGLTVQHIHMHKNSHIYICTHTYRSIFRGLLSYKWSKCTRNNNDNDHDKKHQHQKRTTDIDKNHKNSNNYNYNNPQQAATKSSKSHNNRNKLKTNNK